MMIGVEALSVQTLFPACGMSESARDLIMERP